MMTRKPYEQTRFIVTTLDELIPPDHFLRILSAKVDFSFIYDIMKPLYSSTGRPSIDPVILVKMLLIGYLDGIDSERKIVENVKYNVAYRWFLGLNINDPVPNHSTFSQNRIRRFKGGNVFLQLFEHIVFLCMEEGLVRGENIVMDSTHIKANADNHNMEWVQKTENVGDYWLKLMDGNPNPKLKNNDNEHVTKLQSKNPHDPDAGFMGRRGKPRGFHYLVHQTTDADSGIITGLGVTGGEATDADHCVEQFKQLKERGFNVRRAAMDRGYDTTEIHSELHKLGITTYTPQFDRGNRKKEDKKYKIEDYKYKEKEDVYICPHKKKLTFRGKSFRTGVGFRKYSTSTADCYGCEGQEKCLGKNAKPKLSTGNQTQNTVSSHSRESDAKHIKA